MRGEIMFWLLIAVILAISISSPRYRKAGLTLVGILILTVVVVIAITQRFHERAADAPAAGAAADAPKASRRVDLDQIEWDRLDRQDPDAKNRLALELTHFDQVRATTGSQPQTIEAVQARLYNDSPQFTLTHYAYYLIVQDCVASRCTTVYDQRGRVRQDVPPRQARDVTLSIRDADHAQSPAFRLLGAPKIVLSVTETRAAAAP